ncbi:hypothetical protein BJP41_09555 [Candidatus Williamhamiltonella defendens]|uniref:Transposase IS4-like domain-containing protein n=1 Tax=Candidatus Williamhamiltonella defendens TaxID=138072 RepID=A0A2D3SZQ5_9ENTR|nr:hypothetical protein [Candidatus Hamiltonella defensa]ASV34005.1 hypothetical protein CJJ18_08495 [Candidatus Hamiltonella defensa]ATW23331.1 hypothetical protein BJP44_10095 [Candidatus Hamiltonella defensa]ATW30530.1 hypothetical protein BJP41_09555 [Candidatus Hamiltonella defensa]ATW34292.1 hypothetical protein BJP43_08545 [Candidatus Hamiltonella defensa]AWK16963.1 hypothetical protein CCS40_08310 [Candidatus Hamiltonella defensa]
MMDATYIKIHLHGTETVGDNDGMGVKKGKLNLIFDAHGMPLRGSLTAGTVADCKAATSLLKDLRGDY